ncbi:MAG: class I SAM-dependent methyltransferase [Acidobacteria bacterium]|nr:class I SAM-dependent methyltransferase [Acidobacteriota bacterium]MBI3658196.1 class I SAM-dependent methyltransferase [Acidobacteriota bacterium]
MQATCGDVKTFRPEVNDLKSEVQSHWENEVCGARYDSSISRQQHFNQIEHVRYTLEPYIAEFAGFAQARGKRVLEIGVGAGSDFHNWVKSGAIATGIDLTEAAIALSKEHLEVKQLSPESYSLRRADAENLPFGDNQFDLVYSWGVLHHTPNTALAFREAFRILKPGGTLKAMIYHIPSWTAWMLWAQNCLLKGRPFQSAGDAVFNHLESPGTKAYKIPQAEKMLAEVGFANVQLTTKLGPGDLLQIKPSRKYQQFISKVIWKLYPRWLVKRMGHRYGLYLLIKANKPN